MSQKIRIKNVISDDEKYLKTTDLENMFNIFNHTSGRYMYNLNETIYFSSGLSNLPEIVCEYKQFWSTMSYNIYGTTRLAWLLMKLNNVSIDDIFNPIEPGTKVVYLGNEQIQQLINSLYD